MEKPNGLWISKKTNKESISSSWEELAFAEDDAAGSLWPPRSYTCSFCQREFRSAQALGGHMNIHRRDRARLKQSEYHNDRCDIREKSGYTLVFNSKPRCFYKSQHSCVIDFSSSSSLLFATPSRVSCDLPRKQDSSPSFVVEPTKTSIKILPNSPWPRPHANLDKSHNDLCEISIKDGDKKRKIVRDRPKNIDVSLSMNLVTHQSFENVIVDITKRRRRHESSSYVSSESCKGDIGTSRPGPIDFNA